MEPKAVFATRSSDHLRKLRGANLRAESSRVSLATQAL
jgi:hypothetical protein